MKARLIVTGLSLFILSIASCIWTEKSTRPKPPPTYTPVPTAIEPGLAYGYPCKPPCWWGLIPGQSTREDVAQAIERVRSSEWTYYITEFPEGGYSVNRSSYTLMQLELDNDILYEIDGRAGFYYSTGTLVEQFGNPEGVYLFGREIGACSSCAGWKFDEKLEPRTSAVLLYPGQGLWFAVDMSVDGWGCICPDMPVSWFRYYPPGSMQEALSNHFEPMMRPPSKTQSDQITQEDLVEWHGFGGGY